jgi:mannose-6-phosphate isomerase-like protein (cupin superfamily)
MEFVTDPTPPPSTVPFALDRRTVLHLAGDQSMATVPMDEGSWARAATIPQLQDGRIMSVFAYESSWTWWERHPVGVELVMVLSGAAVFHLRDRAGDGSAALATGDCLLVPEMVWHRAHVTVPTTMLFVTPSPARTEHRDA